MRTIKVIGALLVLQGASLLPVAAQTLYTGRALDFDTRKPLDSVKVEGENSVTFSNVIGFFQVIAQPATKIKVSKRGFIPDSIPLPTSNRFDFYLKRKETPEQTELAKSFYQYMGDNLKYPAEVRRVGAQGIALAYFEVDTSGAITKLEIINNVRKEFSDQLVKLIPKAPKVWYAIKSHNKFILPCIFSMQGSKNIEPPTIPENTGAIVLPEITVTAFYAMR